MDERRISTREELVAAMICALETGSIMTYCLVKNVSVEGSLVECPQAEDLDSVEVGDIVTMTDILVGSKVLFSATHSKVAWVYKRFIGLKFDIPLPMSPEALRSWLVEQSLV